MTDSPPIRVLLVDDHQVVRNGCRRSLQEQANIEVIAEAESGEQARQLYSEHRPDVVIMDLSLPGISGFETLTRILAYDHQAKILVFTMHFSPALAQRAIQAGARGFITKSASVAKLITAVHSIMSGKVYLEPDLANRIAVETLLGSQDPLISLSQRELDILQLIALGRTTKQIGEAIHLSTKTVSNYTTSIKKKLNVTTIGELVHKAIDSGVISEA